MTLLTKAELQTAWQQGEIHGVGFSVKGEANIDDLLDSAIMYDDALVLTEDTHYGRVVMDSGSAFVATTAVEADTSIYLTINSPAGTVGVPYVHTRWAGGSFLIKSSSGTDGSDVAWLMIDPDF
jgi:hypothetical protein